MNIVLIQTYITTCEPEVYLEEPLGLMSLATYVEEGYGAQVNITVLDLYATRWDRPIRKENMYIIGLFEEERIIEELKKYSPDLIGITCNFTAYAQDAMEVAAIAKRAFPDVPVVLGGAHATMEANTIMRENPAIDYIVCGEGEITFKELVGAYVVGDHEAVRRIDGLYYRHNEGIAFTPRRKLMEDINVIPIPNRKYIDMEAYKRINRESLPFTKYEPAATIMTSRGCPFNCIFCSTKVVWERLWRPLTAERVIEEIEYLVKNYGIREIVIQDDQFIIDKKRVHKICDYLIERKLNIRLSIPPGTSIWIADKELLAKMRGSGFYRVCFPIETGNENTLKFIRKPVNLKDVKEKIAFANSIGFWTQGNFIIGFPYETREEIMETIRFAYDCGLDYAVFFVAKPYAGSEMYDIFKKEGLLDTVVRSSHIERSDNDTKTLKAAEINELHAKAVRGFFVHKLLFYLKLHNFRKHLLPKLMTIEDILYAVKVFRVLLKKKILPIIRRMLGLSNYGALETSS